MRTFEKTIQVGTLVKIEGIGGFHQVKEINGCRNLIKITTYAGAFQRGHVEKYTNKLTLSND